MSRLTQNNAHSPQPSTRASRARRRLTRACRVIALTLLCALPTPRAHAQDSAPGAMRPDGSFFMIRNNGNNMQAFEWISGPAAGVWQIRGQLTGVRTLSKPAGRTPTGGFHFTANSGPNTRPFLMQWEPNRAIPFTVQGVPFNNVAFMSPPSEVMYGNRVLVSAGTGDRDVAGFGFLSERFMWGNTQWVTFPRPFGKLLNMQAPCVLKDGNVIAVDSFGNVVHHWWDTTNNTWNWYNHGPPSRNVKAVSIGGAMPLTNKFFVTSSDGTLRQIFYWNGAWLWHNHGKPFGFNVDSPAVSILDGKLFVRASSGGQSILAQLYWNGSWIWFNHGAPPNTGILSVPATAMGGETVSLLGTDGNYHLCQWNGAAWVWRNIGRP